MTPEQQKDIYTTILNGVTPLIERMQVDFTCSPYPREMQESVKKAKEIMRNRTKELSSEEIDEIAEELVVKIE